MRRVGFALALLLSTATIAPTSAAAAESDEPIGAVSGVWFFDRNQDGLQQPDEPGAQEFPVQLSTAEGMPVSTAYTGADGHYNIGNLAPGKYKLAFRHSGYIGTTTPDEVPVTITEGHNEEIGFGLRGGEISGIAWEDSNGDGQRQEEEPPLGGVPIRLNNGAAPIGYTQPDGTYRMQDLRIADTLVQFEVREDMPFAPPLVGEASTDSDVIDFDEGTANAHLWIGTPGIINAPNIDAGYVPAP